MSDPFYTLVKLLGRPVFWLASRPLVLYGERLDRPGAFVVAANHRSPYDVPILIRHARRHLDFVSITEVFCRPSTGWLYGQMNAFPLERSRPDAGTIRTILRRLQQGRAVAMFPEGRITPLAESVVSGGRMRPGIGRIAQLARVPVIPVAIAGSEAFGRLKSWLPLRGVRYGLSVGEPIVATAAGDDDDPAAAAAATAAARIEGELKRSLIALHRELTAALGAAPGGRQNEP